MIKPLTEHQKNRIDAILGSLSVEQMAGQVLAWRFPANTDEDIDNVKRTLDEVPLGCLSLGMGGADQVRRIREEILQGRDLPIIMSCNLTNGPGSQIIGTTLFPWEMAVGAANNEGWAETMGESTAREGRELGVHWTLSPVIDLNINFRNCMMHCRSFGEKTDHVARITSAFIRGVQKDGLMAATCKHFPGDGLDSRDSHICTLINPVSREQWHELYGPVWKSALDEGAMSVMGGHIALPAIDPDPVGGKRWLGPAPATLSYRLQMEFLREELGFEGLIVSDAIPMIGYASHIPASEYAPATLRAGTDMVLFVNPKREYECILAALKEKRLTEERLADAARKVLELKARVGLLDEEQPTVTVSDEERRGYEQCANLVGEHSVCMVRNEDNAVPVTLKPGAKVLNVSIQLDQKVRGVTQGLATVDEELRNRGYEVDSLINPFGQKLNEIAHEYDAVFVNLHILPRYGTTALAGGPAMTLWRSFWTSHPQVVFTSFGDPYKIYEMPYVPNMLNCFSNAPASQRAAVKVWLGEIEAKGTSPVSLEGFFEATVS